MYYKIEQLKNILASRKNCVFSLDHLCSSALEYIQHLEAGIDRCYELAKQVESAQPKWISVEERVPEIENENGTLKCTETVLAADKNGCLYTGCFRIYKYDESTEFVGFDHYSFDAGEFEVTHWMPLPSTEGLE